ncbi:MAG: nucleotidyltransferase domain-containing protein [Lentisphaeria bacterium]|nr:nucleotidyltransferase domain-containing protein [Lentisphaeria bacterium]
MVDGAVLAAVKEYLALVARAGITVEAGVVFGSCVRGEQDADSDIDLLVVSPDFDRRYDHELIDRLWSLRRFVDSRIEPHAVGSLQFRQDTGTPLIGVARREGVIVPCSA